MVLSDSEAKKCIMEKLNEGPKMQEILVVLKGPRVKGRPGPPLCVPSLGSVPRANACCKGGITSCSLGEMATAVELVMHPTVNAFHCLFMLGIISEASVDRPWWHVTGHAS